MSDATNTASLPATRNAAGTPVSQGGERALRSLKGVGYLAFIAIAIVAPLVFDSVYELDVLVTMTINAILATGLAIVVRAGRLSLAQATFGGIGGYTSGILMMQQDWTWWPSLLMAGVVAAVFGVLLGLTSLRLRGFYFAIATFTFSQIVIQLLSAWKEVTGGLSGMFGLPIPPNLFGADWLNPETYYYFGLFTLACALLVYYLCTLGTRFGRGLTVLGEDETVAGSIGVPATQYRIAAFAISSFIAGIAGSLNAHFIGGISPSDIVPAVSVFVLVMVMAGGSRTFLGPVIGAVILTAIPEFLRISAQWSMVLYGVFLLAYVFLFRQGILPLFDQFARFVIGALAGGRAVASPTSAVTARAPRKPATPPGRPAPAGRPDKPVLTLDQVQCAFGTNVVLKDVSFSVTAGELLGVIGPNGAGKTTLFNLITGNAPLKSGRVLLEGLSVKPNPAGMARRGIARTFQHPKVLPLRTVAESIRVAAELRGVRPDAGYLDWVVQVTGLEALLERRAASLSHYERRLLTIAMAIASRPKVLLFDEPLAGLDETETQVVKEKIRDIHDQLGCTLLLIEHKLSVVMELCQRLVVLDFGQVIAEGQPAAVAKNPAVIQAYLGS